jgi:hypothetical protein
MQSKIANESDLLSAGFPDQTIVLLSNTLAGVVAMLNYSQVTRDLNNFTPFAFLKSAGYAIASTLGISPRRRMGAQQTVKIVSGDGFPDFSQQISPAQKSITIPAYTQFTCRNMTWHTRSDYLISYSDTEISIEVFEGIQNSISFTSTGEKFQRWLVGNQYEVDQDTVRVFINNEYWAQGIGTFVKYLATDQVFIPTTSPDGRVLILFGNGIYGVIPASGNTIQVLYTTTLGAQGNNASIGDTVLLNDTIVVSEGVGLLITCSTTTVASGGSDEEDLDSIKYVTPRLYAANERSVRRDDYIGQLLGADCPVAMDDARVWGEYEQAIMVGLGTLDMMNRAFWGGVLSTILSYSDGQLATADGYTSTFVVTLSQSLPIPGSSLFSNNDPGSNSKIVFSDIDGYGVLTSPRVSFDTLLTPDTNIYATSDIGTTISNVIDGSPDTAWTSGFSPSLTNPLYIMIIFSGGSQQVPKSFRFRASNDTLLDDRSFPDSISCWGSNGSSLVTAPPGTPPSINFQPDWIPIRGNVYPPEPGVEGYTNWYALNNNTAYTYLRFQINGTYGASSYCKVSEIEVQIAPNSSTIDYNTSGVVLRYPNNLATNAIISAQYYAGNLTTTQQSEVASFILNTNHFTTQFSYSSCRMVRADLSLQVFYNPAYSRNTVLAQVSKTITDLLKIKKGSISKSIKFSDYGRVVSSVPGVDYHVFINPVQGADTPVDTDQYVYLTSLNIQMTASDR